MKKKFGKKHMEKWVIQFCFSYFGIGGIVCDWGFRICLVYVLFSQQLRIAILILPILFIVNIIGNFRWSRIAYIIIGCFGWYWALVGFGHIADAFHSFFVWAIVFFIFGSIPISSMSSKSSDEAPHRIDIFHTANGTPYYNDSDGNMHQLNESGKLWRDSDGNSFDKNGYKH